ncbi:MAG: helix-turn-helix transcriptional regulator [Cohaesibacteraceae bacterium]|nr:helix-turn-helix transcriptional regulator [Cohaesibacteraceae bacterium]
MTPQLDIGKRLSTRLKETRKSKGLSLDAVSRLSGVSRSMLSQIERGESSPTVSTLWNLTRALQVDFAGLLDEDDKQENPVVEFVSSNRTPTIDSRGDNCRIQILSPPDQAGKHEVYDISLESDGLLESEPHRQGCVEHLTALVGCVTVTSDGISTQVNCGDTIRYRADKPHAISSGDNAARALLIVINP